MEEFKGLSSFDKLKNIIAKLRGPEGCPWDKKQTHNSLKPYLIEECYEVLRALEEGSSPKLCSEMGDLLLQIMLHAQIEDEKEEFNIENVIDSICTKLIQRHPHVFGGKQIKDVAEVELNWENLKKEERHVDESLLSGIPEHMPALVYSQSIQRRVASVGFDWEKKEDIIDKLVEEVDELVKSPDEVQRAKEFGDLIFTLVNIARRMDIDLEMSLRETNRRFYNRFMYIEKACRKQGVDISELSLDEQNVLWDEAKRYD